MKSLKLFNSLSKPAPSTDPHNPLPALPILRREYNREAVYVPPRVTDARSGATMHLDRVVGAYQNAVIVGPPGAGKTSALTFISKGATVLSLGDAPPGALPSTLRDDLILLDQAQTYHADYLARLAREHPNARVFATAEDAGAVPSGLATLLLQFLNEREIGSAAEAWFPAGRAAGHRGFQVVNRAAQGFVSAVKADQRTRLLATNPLNLFLLLQVYANGAPLPTHHAALFDAYVTSWLQADPGVLPPYSGVPSSPAGPEFAARALEGIALATKRGELAKAEHLPRGYGFLQTAANGRVEFVHPLLRDFLTARALRRNPDPGPMLEHVPDDEWREVLLFYAGLGDPRALVEALLEGDRLDLAAHALAQAPEIPDDLQQRLVAPLIKRAWEEENPDAIDGLRALRSNAATDFLAGRLKERDPVARARAASILGRLNTDRAVEYLLPQLRDTDATVRDQIVASLGQSTSDRVVEPLLVALRGDSRVGSVDTRMRVAAARALGEVGTEKAVPALIVDLQVGDPVLRAEAVRALVKIRSNLALKPLQAIVVSNQSGEVRAAAEQVLKEAWA